LFAGRFQDNGAYHKWRVHLRYGRRAVSVGRRPAAALEKKKAAAAAALQKEKVLKLAGLQFESDDGLGKLKTGDARAPSDALTISPGHE